MPDFERGSEWKRWDLHFHTPSSYDYGDKSVTNQTIIDAMDVNGVTAFAVTDHHVIDIDRFKELKKLGFEKGIFVLPGIEFLSDARGSDPIHFIGIFSEQSDIQYIWDQIKNCTNIKDIYGKDIAPNQIYCDLDDTIRLVHELGGIATIHAGGKHSSIECITNSLPHAMAQKKDIAEVINIFELGKESDQEGYTSIVFPAINKVIPMIICSDNHNINKYVLKQNLWVKGTPNFEGLKYALTEPQERFFIGEEPEILSRVSQNKTKYIDTLKIIRTGTQDVDNEWFYDISIPINSELVTIIGNKGSGKSALADIIGLCCDAEHSEDYQFLHKKKFKQRGLADRFSSSVIFKSGKVTELKSLLEEVDSNAQPLVRYLPQTYFEKVCNEIGKTEAFREEIEKVVFQYIPVQDRLGKSNFTELVNYKKESVDKEIIQLVEKIVELNSKIIELEDKSNPKYKEKLVNRKKVKEDELSSHNESKPKEIADPSKEIQTEESIKQQQELDKWKDEQLDVERKIEDVRQEITQLSINIETLSSIKRLLSNKVQELDQIILASQEDAESLGIDLSKVVNHSFNFEPIDTRLNDIKKDKEALELQLVVRNEELVNDYATLNLVTRYEKCNEEISHIQSKLSREHKAYQIYLNKLADWQQVTKEIEGDDTIEGSLNYLSVQIGYVENTLPAELLEVRNERLNLSLQIYAKKSEVKLFYDEIKKQIDEKLSDSDGTGLSIASAFYTSQDFIGNLLGYIRQNRMGTYYGADAAKAHLKDVILHEVDWDKVDDVKGFLVDFIESLEIDMRDMSQGESTYIGTTVGNRNDLYRYLFSLTFLEPFYDLRQNNKSLEQLSPGEKGALLLVFYLVLDNEDIPLIIDQPEDNLDNHSVAQVLVPFIREAKKKRQIIMVTHNPNLAVVADSEQVIRVEIDKEQGNLFSYVSGGIEMEKTKDAIVDVLEGTMPAFQKRNDKYQVS